MFMAVMTLEFHLEGCRSLKEKRSRLSGLRDKHGRRVNVAVCESDYHDTYDRAEWTIVAVSGSKTIVERTLDQIESQIDGEVDAVITYSHIDWI